MNMHSRVGRVPASAPPPSAGGWIAFPIPNTPEARKAIGALRREARAEIERLLAFLDRTEGDHDLEDGGDAEPSLGWTANGAGGVNDDREDDDCDREDDGDREEDEAERGLPL